MTEHKTLNNDSLPFTDVIGSFDVLDNLVLLPKTEGLTNIPGLREAEASLRILSGIVLGNKSVITHGDIENREYLFFYSDDGVFTFSRVYEDQLECLSFFSYMDVNLVVFLGREINIVNKHSRILRMNAKKREKKGLGPTVGVIFEANKAKSLNFALHTLTYSFPSVDTTFLLDSGLYKVEKKEGSMVLC